jgi:hypothetical protein
MGDVKTIHRLQVVSLLSKLDTRVVYGGEQYGLSGDGSGVKLLIIDSGVPEHDAIPVDGSPDNRVANFTTSPKNRDLLGYATIVGGILGANGEHIRGMLPQSEIFYAKAIDDHAMGKFDSIIASVLWGIIKGVDVILLPLAHSTDNYALHEAISKAHAANICLVAPVGENNASYPAAYTEVLAVGKTGEIDLPGDDFISCYLENTYAKVNGIACSAATVAGLCALVIEGKNRTKTRVKPSDVYSTVTGLAPR